MEHDDERDEHNAHNWTGLGWQSAKLVRKLKSQLPERRGEAEATPRKSREGAPKGTSDFHSEEASGQIRRPPEAVES